MPNKDDPPPIDAPALEWDWDEALNPDDNLIPQSPESVMWLRVIQMAMFDFCSGDSENRDSATRWLLHGDEHFKMVCDLAGINAESLTQLCRSYWKNQDLMRMLRARIFRVPV